MTERSSVKLVLLDGLSDCAKRVNRFLKARKLLEMVERTLWHRTLG